MSLVIGTRPEAIKLAPLAKALAARGLDPLVVLTGQHPQLRPDDFGLSGFRLTELDCAGLPDPHAHAGMVARKIGTILGGGRLVVVQGDTSSALGGALGAAETGVAVAHVEAGLRSHDRENPWPEEGFRIAIDRLADLLFAPTVLNAANLRRERVAGEVVVTGNTGIDALLQRMPGGPVRLNSDRRRLLVTCHRRESWGEGLHAIATCLRVIANRGDVEIRLVLHPNPRVADEMRSLLGGHPGIRLENPCGHVGMLRRMQASDIILSDSGGIQEEAPALGVPLLVLRERTERPEGIASGNAVLVGRDADRIHGTVEMLLSNDELLAAMRLPAFPYGDGQAADRIADAIAFRLGAYETVTSISAAAIEAA